MRDLDQGSSEAIFTARIPRMGEGNSFSLLVCPHPGGGGGLPTLDGGGGSYLPWMVDWGGGTYLGWWMGGTYLGQGGTYLGWWMGGIPR